MTEFKIEVNLAHVPEGTPVELYGLGTYSNGDTYDVSDELVQLFRINHPMFDVREDDEKVNADVMDTLNPQEGIRIFRTEATLDSGESIKTFNELAQVLEQNQMAPVDPLDDTGSENVPTDMEEESK